MTTLRGQVGRRAPEGRVGRRAQVDDQPSPGRLADGAVEPPAPVRRHGADPGQRDVAREPVRRDPVARAQQPEQRPSDRQPGRRAPARGGVERGEVERLVEHAAVDRVGAGGRARSAARRCVRPRRPASCRARAPARRTPARPSCTGRAGRRAPRRGAAAGRGRRACRGRAAAAPGSPLALGRGQEDQHDHTLEPPPMLARTDQWERWNRRAETSREGAHRRADAGGDLAARGDLGDPARARAVAPSSATRSSRPRGRRRATRGSRRSTAPTSRS